MSDAPVLIDRQDDGLVILTLNRPQRRNALGKELVTALRQTLDELATDVEARVVVITGAGPKAFCAGADLKERAQMSPPEVQRFVTALRAMMDEIAALPKPTIAAINGYALGGGCELALSCDLRIAAEGASLGLPETHLGIIPGAGGTQRLPRLLGPALAKELIFTSRRLTGTEAAAIGLVNRVCPDDKLLEEAANLAAPILTAAPIALAQAKAAIDAGLEVDLASGMKIEKACYAVTIPTEDRLEALAAFKEKRRPQFKGR